MHGGSIIFDVTTADCHLLPPNQIQQQVVSGSGSGWLPHLQQVLWTGVISICSKTRSFSCDDGAWKRDMADWWRSADSQHVRKENKEQEIIWAAIGSGERVRVKTSGSSSSCHIVAVVHFRN